MAGKDYTSVVDQMADKYNVPREYARAIYEIETNSGKNVKVSSAGASGHMQLMPGTARQMGITNIHDPIQNIEGGVKYFSGLLQTFGDPVLAAAAYNAGPGKVARARGVPNIAETKHYVQKFVNLAGSAAKEAPEATPEAPSAPAPQVASVPDMPQLDLASRSEEHFASLMAGLGKKKKRKSAMPMGILAGIA
jgi:soluble lytic murein transglycosylase-like protein